MIIILYFLSEYPIEDKVDSLQLGLILLVLLKLCYRLLVLILIENADIAALHVLREIATNRFNQLIHLWLRYPNNIGGDIYLLATEELAGLVL